MNLFCGRFWVSEYTLNVFLNAAILNCSVYEVKEKRNSICYLKFYLYVKDEIVVKLEWEVCLYVSKAFKNRLPKKKNQDRRFCSWVKTCNSSSVYYLYVQYIDNKHYQLCYWATVLVDDLFGHLAFVFRVFSWSFQDFHSLTTLKKCFRLMKMWNLYT